MGGVVTFKGSLSCVLGGGDVMEDERQDHECLPGFDFHSFLHT